MMPLRGLFSLCLTLVTASATATAALAQQNDYGGYDIVSMGGGESYYGTTRGWNVFAARGPAGFGYCFAEASRDGSPYRLGWDGQQWQLAVPIQSNPDWQGTLEIDGAGSGRGYMTGGAYISGTALGGWTIAWLGEAELDGIRQGSVAVLGVGRGDFDFSLAGATAATLKVRECVERAGAAPAAAPVPVAAPSERVAVPFASPGDWQVNELRAGGQVQACEAYDRVQNTLRFEIDRDSSYIDFTDRGPMGGALGAGVLVNVGFGSGSAAQPYLAQIVEGQDGAAWGRITEARGDGPGLLDDSFQNAAQVSFQGPGIFLDRDLTGSHAALEAFFRCSASIR